MKFRPSAAWLFLGFMMGAVTAAANPFVSEGQSIYRQGVPHTDKNGQVRHVYDPSRSFFPIGIYHALTGIHHGISFDFAHLTKAGFNTLHSWEGQHLGPVALAAKAQGLRVIHHNPTDKDIADWQTDGPILVWYLNEEPTLRVGKSQFSKAFQAFTARVAEIRKRDPDRAVIVIDSPHVDRPHWPEWNGFTNVSAHWNYPMFEIASDRQSRSPSIRKSVSAAVALNKKRKPVWLVVQAFSSPIGPWRMPTAAELRAMVFSGLINGATGIIYFAYDSFVTRDGQVIGVAPNPKPDYGATPDYNADGLPPMAATAEQVRQSRSLWADIAKLNRELAQIVPYVLSPTSDLNFNIVADERGHPIQAMLKSGKDDDLLIAFNESSKAVHAQFRFEDPVFIAPFGGGRFSLLTAEDVLLFAPNEAKLFRVQKRPVEK